MTGCRFSGTGPLIRRMEVFCLELYIVVRGDKLFLMQTFLPYMGHL